MAIYSVAFLGIVLVFLLFHEIVGKLKGEYQWIIRLAASITFYVYAAGLMVVFIGISAVSVYFTALAIQSINKKGKLARKAEGLSKEDKKLIKKKTQNKKRIVMFATISFNLLILLTTKYILPTVGFNIVLPLGISFYTLQAIAYIVDVYGDKYEPQDNFFKLLLYLSWFPQLIQGPINRYDAIREDLYKVHRLTAYELKYGFYLFIFGAIKRYAVADILSPVVEKLLCDYTANYSGACLLFGAFLFAIEQYANFSGGIDMVMGISMLYGVKLADNFRQPYFSKTLAEFWRRWHISLGAFMRDYVFYPFAMLKSVQKLMKKVSDASNAHWGRALIGGMGNLIVFALVGYWHGPQLHFLAWGLYNGIIIAISDALAPFFDIIKDKLKIKTESKFYQGFQMLRTFMIIVFAGYFDIVDTVSVGIRDFLNTFLHFDIGQFIPTMSVMMEENVFDIRSIVVVLLGICVMLMVSVIREKKIDPIDRLINKKLALRWIICYAMIFLILYSFAISNGSGGFMYAAF